VSACNFSVVKITGEVAIRRQEAAEAGARPIPGREPGTGASLRHKIVMRAGVKREETGRQR